MILTLVQIKKKTYLKGVSPMNHIKVLYVYALTFYIKKWPKPGFQIFLLGTVLRATSA